jgi:RNA polymerase sigma-70 factor, ECF subfamily
VTGATAEGELIRRARAGDQDAFGELVADNSDRVYGALRRFGLDQGEADEVAQEVFLRAWRGLPRFAFNEAQRRLSRRRPASVIPDPEAPDPIADLPDAPERGPEARALDDELMRALEMALLALPPDWRMAVVLRDIEGLSTEEAAAVVGIGPAAFKSRLHRGRMRLRELVEPYLTS